MGGRKGVGWNSEVEERKGKKWKTEAGWEGMMDGKELGSLEDWYSIIM